MSEGRDQSRIENHVNHPRWSFEVVNYFYKNFTSDVWQGSEYASEDTIQQYAK